jgi:hypothetical protein
MSDPAYHRPGDYAALKAYGHSPAKAAEIVLDAKRGDFFSRGWIKVVRQALFGAEESTK